MLDPEGRRPTGDVTAATRRAEALSDAPVLQGAFDDGQLPAAHLDLVARARRQLTGTRRRAFEAAHERLVAAARRQSLADFRRTLASVIDEIDAAHGAGDVERLRRQRSLRRWWNRDGLRHWHLAVDPEAGARPDGALDAQIEALFHRDRNANGGEVRRSSEQLACDALGDLVAGGHAAKRPGRAEIIVHVDHDTLARRAPLPLHPPRQQRAAAHTCSHPAAGVRRRDHPRAARRRHDSARRRTRIAHGNPGSTACPCRGLRRLRNHRVRCAVRPLPGPSHRRVERPRLHRPRGARPHLRQAPPPRARPPLADVPRPAPGAAPLPPRRHPPPCRPSSPTSEPVSGALLRRRAPDCRTARTT